MEKIKSSVGAKLLAMVLIIVSVAAICGSAAAIIACDAAGLYSKEKNEVLKERYADVCDKYSVMAMAGYEEDFNIEQLSKTNFRFGVIKADDITGLDLSDRSRYVVDNFDVGTDFENLHVYSCYMGKHIQAEYGKSIFDSFYLHDDGYVEENHYTVDGYVYDWQAGEFYFRSGKKLFLCGREPRVQLSEQDWYYGIGSELLKQQESRRTSEIAYEWKNKEQTVVFEDLGLTLRLGDVDIVNSIGLRGLGRISSGDIQYINDGSIYVMEQPREQEDNYYVLSCVKEPLAGVTSMQDGDLFMQAKLLVDFGYTVRYPAIAVLGVAIILLLASAVFLLCAAGHHRGCHKITPYLLDRLPVDLYACLMLCAEGLLFLAVYGTGMCADPFEHALFWIVSACAGVAGVVIFTGFCMSFAVNVKLGGWWRNTVLYWCIRQAGKLLRLIVAFCKKIVQGMVTQSRLCIVLLVLAAFEFFVIEAFCYVNTGAVIMLWLLEKAVTYPVIFLLFSQMGRLQQGAARLARGESGSRIQTETLWGDLKKHGMYLNDISSGINHAVNERMKSERFKTELITNVSHDIKTPLTSIVNYVDLMGKEPIENETVREYLEVLKRQSARLKKLIEDLMEASKASTGNLSVVMEQCDTGVMLVQTVGEFEEKLMENQIELQIKKPEEQILIEADSRHLWRVFDNLMNNICKYSQPQTRAYIHLERTGDRAVITFRNISRYELNLSSEELMERFVRGDSSRNTEGSGLGLSIAMSLTQLMHGTFQLMTDGDLFKVIVSFPVYGCATAGTDETKPCLPAQTADVYEASDVGNMLTHGARSAGAHVKSFGAGMARGCRRFVKKTGRFVRGVRQVAADMKNEEKQ